MSNFSRALILAAGLGISGAAAPAPTCTTCGTTTATPAAGNSSSSSSASATADNSANNSVTSKVTVTTLPGFVASPESAKPVNCFVAEGWRVSLGASIAAGGVANIGATTTSAAPASSYKEIPGCVESQTQLAVIQAGLTPGANKNVALLAAETAADKLGPESAFSRTLNDLANGDPATLKRAGLFATTPPVVSQVMNLPPSYIQAAPAPVAAASAPAAPAQTFYVNELSPSFAQAIRKKGTPVGANDPITRAGIPCNAWKVLNAYLCVDEKSPANGRVFSVTGGGGVREFKPTN